MIRMLKTQFHFFYYMQNLLFSHTQFKKCFTFYMAIFYILCLAYYTLYQNKQSQNIFVPQMRANKSLDKICLFLPHYVEKVLGLQIIFCFFSYEVSAQNENYTSINFFLKGICMIEDSLKPSHIIVEYVVTQSCQVKGIFD